MPDCDRILGCCIIAAFILLPSGAYAGETHDPDNSQVAEDVAPSPEDQQRARELFENGVILYEEGRFEESIVAWEEAYRLSSAPLLLFNIANAHERLGALEDALDFLNRYRAFATTDERETIDRRIRNMERRIDEQRVAQARPEPTPATPEVTEDARDRSQENRAVNGKVVAQIGLGTLAVGSAVTGVVLGIQASNRRNDLEGTCTPEGICPTSVRDIRDQEKNFALGADIAFGVAAASAIAFTIVTFALRPGRDTDSSESEEARVRVSPTFGAGQAGFSLSGRF